MSAVTGDGTFEKLQDDERTWGEFEGRSGTEARTNWYTEVFHDIEEVLEDATEYIRFENVELPKEQVLEKYREVLEPGEDEYLEASLNQYSTSDGQFKILELEKGDIDNMTVTSEGYSHRPVIQTNRFPGNGEKLVDINKGKSDTYQIIWEE